MGLRGAFLAVTCVLAATSALAAETTRVSVTSAGAQALARDSFLPSISADGRHVAFHSDAANLVAGDTNNVRDIFVHDRLTRVTSRVSVDSAGAQGNGMSSNPAISADGRFVAFYSSASNLVPGDTNYTLDVFVHDRATRATSLVSVSSAGAQGDGQSYAPAISADGRHVAFTSGATNLVGGGTDGELQVYVRDRVARVTSRVSVDSAGLRGDADSDDPAISADGRFVAFESIATNLVAGDANGQRDVFVHDRTTRATTRASVGSAGEEGDWDSQNPAISADGRFVAFDSGARSLVPGTYGGPDILVRDRTNGVTTVVSVDPGGASGMEKSVNPAISADGRWVAFESFAQDLVPGDTNDTFDVFVRDRTAGVTSRVSLDSADGQSEAYAPSYNAAISADGRHVAFDSVAASLVAGDTNARYDAFVRDRLVTHALQADVRLAVTAKPASVRKGANARYTLTITNNGPDAAADVSLIDVVANGRAMGLVPSQGACRKAAVSVCSLGALAPGASATVAVTLKALAHPLTQKLTVGGGPLDAAPANNRASVSTKVVP